jgi:hypothetical protein
MQVPIPEVEGKHPTTHQVFASDTHPGRLELCNPSSRIGPTHLCNSRPVQYNWGKWTIPPIRNWHMSLTFRNRIF